MIKGNASKTYLKNTLNIPEQDIDIVSLGFPQVLLTMEDVYKRQFIFNVTMQNHGGYTDTYYGFDNTVTADKLNNSCLLYTSRCV